MWQVQRHMQPLVGYNCLDTVAVLSEGSAVEQVVAGSAAAGGNPRAAVEEPAGKGDPLVRQSLRIARIW